MLVQRAESGANAWLLASARVYNPRPQLSRNVHSIEECKGPSQWCLGLNLFDPVYALRLFLVPFRGSHVGCTVFALLAGGV